MNPWNSMGNNPVSYSDPNGDFIPQLVGGIVGGIINVGSQALQGNVTSLGEGLSYFGVGAASGALALTPGGMGAARIIMVAGNKTIQVATGKFTLDNVDSAGDLAMTALDLTLDATMPGLTKAVARPLANNIIARETARLLGEPVIKGSAYGQIKLNLEANY